jgi:hypothetical protein
MVMSMAINVDIATISNEDYNDFIKNFTCPYLQLAIDYSIAMKNEIELFLSEDEKRDLENKIDLLHLT